MADNSTSPADKHRHAHRPVPRGHRHVRLAVLGAVVVTAIAAVLVLYSWDRSDDAVAEQRAVSPVASTPPTTPPTTTAAPTPDETTSEPDVPGEFVDAMRQLGIPLGASTGWDVAQGICVRLAQPEYDQFKMSEGVERLFPSVSDEQAHAFVTMVADSVCHM